MGDKAFEIRCIPTVDDVLLVENGKGFFVELFAYAKHLGRGLWLADSERLAGVGAGDLGNSNDQAVSEYHQSQLDGKTEQAGMRHGGQ